MTVAPTHTNKTFNPRAYLEEYYTNIGLENDALLRFYANAFRQPFPEAKLLDFGGGPTLYPLISAAPKVQEIYFSDYLYTNLEEVRRWCQAQPNAFSWKPFIKRALAVESVVDDDLAIAAREVIIREKIKRFLWGDIQLAAPLGHCTEYQGYFDIVMSNFVAECVTNDRGEWQQGVAHLVSLLKVGGILLMTVITDATSYKIGPTAMPCTSVTESDVIHLLSSLGFARSDINAHSIPAETQPIDGTAYQGYRGITFIKAVKRGIPRSIIHF